MDGFQGDLLFAERAGFAGAARDGLFNQLRPDRLPQVIAQVANAQDIARALQYARAQGLRVVVRGGGHNWCSPSLRRGGLMLDLSRLNRVISVDAERRLAVTEPIVSNREILAALVPHGLAYPSGHCPTVKLSGYLLGGGMSWNHGVWGPGVGSVEAIELVLPDGRQVTASRQQHPDLFWAARGAGPGFFAVAHRYHLRLYPLPRAIAACAYYYPLEEVRRVAEWLGPVADRIPPCVELSLFMIEAPAELGIQGKVCAVTATVFADSPAEAAAAAAALEECPIRDRCLSRTFLEPTSFSELFDLSGSLWPEGLRCRVDAAFSNQPLGKVIDLVADHFAQTPSPKTVLMFAVYTGGSAPATPDDALFSATGRLYGGPWTMWESADHDGPNERWHDRCVELLAPVTHTRYMSESNTVAHPDFVGQILGDSQARLESLRRQYDPDGLFFDYLDALD